MLPSLLFCAALHAGCGGQEEPGDDWTDAGSGGETAGVARYTPDKGTATITGRVRWLGEPPKRRPIDMGANKYCLNCNPGRALSETVIVGEGGGLANVFVRIKYGLRGWKFARPKGEVLLDQIKCRYVPHMLGLRAGQNLRVRNSDPILHNVHALPIDGGKEAFNLAQTQRGQETVETIRRQGMYVGRCEVHGWMTSHIGVSKHPFFAVTGEDGEFVLAHVPPGEYTLEAWHEKYGPKKRKLTLGEGQTAEVTFTYKR